MLIFLYEITFTFCMMCITLENVRRHFSLAGENVVDMIFSKVSLFSLAFIPFLALVPLVFSVTFRVLEAPVNYSVSSYGSSLPSFVFKTTVWKHQ